jgi:PIN domain nuclease of toxin-antitoxin system
LSDSAKATIAQETEVAISAISCWEIAKAVERGALQLDGPLEDWMGAALSEPRIRLIPLTPEIAIESTRLPRPFHRDPADQIIVATARVLGASLLTADRKIRRYPHVSTV